MAGVIIKKPLLNLKYVKKIDISVLRKGITLSET